VELAKKQLKEHPIDQSFDQMVPMVMLMQGQLMVLHRALILLVVVLTF
jgi:hypothetical protein